MISFFFSYFIIYGIHVKFISLFESKYSFPINFCSCVLLLYVQNTMHPRISFILLTVCRIQLKIFYDLFTSMEWIQWNARKTLCFNIGTQSMKKLTRSFSFITVAIACCYEVNRNGKKKIFSYIHCWSLFLCCLSSFVELSKSILYIENNLHPTWKQSHELSIDTLSIKIALLCYALGKMPWIFHLYCLVLI